MKGLVRVEICCREHEKEDLTCSVCCFLHRTEVSLQMVGRRRDQLFREIKAKLASSELIIIDLR